MKIKHLDHLNMTVANLEESIRWYGDVFGFEVVESGVRNGAPWAIIQSGEALLCMYEDTSRSGPQQFLKRGGDAHTIYHFGLRITDRDTWLAKIEEHNIHLEYDGEVDYPHSTSWYVFDPTGFGIEIAIWNEDQIRFDLPAPDANQDAAA